MLLLKKATIYIKSVEQVFTDYISSIIYWRDLVAYAEFDQALVEGVFLKVLKKEKPALPNINVYTTLLNIQTVFKIFRYSSIFTIDT